MRRRPWSSLLAVALSAAAGSAPWQAQAQTLTGATPQTIAPSAAACRPDPLGGRALYLRGGFNNWSAADAQRFTWACNRHELVARIEGEHRFKLGDEAWSADADFGSAASAASASAERPWSGRGSALASMAATMGAANEVPRTCR